MKKYILALGVCCMAGAMPLFAQESNSELTEAQRELQGYMDEGLVKFKSDNDKFSFRVGGRVAIDGAHYIDDYTDRFGREILCRTHPHHKQNRIEGGYEA